MAAETRPVQPLGSLVLRVEAEQEQRYSEQQVHSSTCRSFKSGLLFILRLRRSRRKPVAGVGGIVLVHLWLWRSLLFGVFSKNCIKLFFERDILLTLDELA